MNSYYEQFKTGPDFGKLTDGQKSFMQAALSGKNVFLTGGAGTGKSFCADILCKFLAENDLHPAKTASTGIAALTIKGQTIHSFAGVGLADKDTKSIINDVKKNKKASNRIRNVKILILDEVSMIDGDLFDKLDVVFKYFRFNNRPFGGVQLILFGDMLQLPPVFKVHQNKQTSFCFESRAWKEADINICLLTEIMRQTANSEFALALNKIRQGDATGLPIIQSRDGVKLTGRVEPINLFSVNVKADEYNNLRLNKIQGSVHEFNAIEFGDKRHLDNLDRNCLAPKRLVLKIGCQVILLSNLDVETGWVNGTICKVVKIENDVPVVERSDGATAIVEMDQWDIKESIIQPNGEIEYNVVASRKQIPLKLGYAISIHKSQSLTLDRVRIDFDRCFEFGQVYVALSRVRTLDGLTISNLNARDIKAHPKCLEFYTNLK